MPALVRGNGNSLNIFLYGAINNFLNLPVVPQVNYLHAGALQYAAHDVDGGIVAVEQRGGSNYTDVVFRLIDCGLHTCTNIITTNI